MKEARQRYESRLVEVDCGRKQEYEYKLTEGLSQMRAQNEEQIQLYKDSLESTYHTRVGPLPGPRLTPAGFRSGPCDSSGSPASHSGVKATFTWRRWAKVCCLLVTLRIYSAQRQNAIVIGLHLRTRCCQAEAQEGHMTAASCSSGSERRS